MFVPESIGFDTTTIEATLDKLRNLDGKDEKGFHDELEPLLSTGELFLSHLKGERVDLGEVENANRSLINGFADLKRLSDTLVFLDGRFERDPDYKKVFENLISSKNDPPGCITSIGKS